MKPGQEFQFYAAAKNDAGQIGQVLVTRRWTAENSEPVSQQWTGKVYRSQSAAERDLAGLNRAMWSGLL